MQTGQIIKALSGFYYIKVGQNVYQTRARGVFRKQKRTPLVGDIVQFSANSLKEGIVEDICPRKNQLIRPPMANIDQAVIVMSAVEPDFSTLLVDRFLVYLEAHHIKPLLVITKTDLLSTTQRQAFEKLCEQYHSIGYKTWLSDTLIADPTDFFTLLQDQTVVFMGQSGVGKSTLLNFFLPQLAIETGEISSALGRGRHTTRHVALHAVHGVLIADTPGFSTVQLDDIEKEQLPHCFPEFEPFRSHCKFRECQHVDEPTCGVKTAVEQNEIWTERYQHYLTFLEEIKKRKSKYKK